MERLGLDLGTKNIVLAYNQKDKKKVKREINGFLALEANDGVSKNLLVQSGVSYVELDDKLIVIGQKAEDLAFAFNKTLQRPMVDGVLSGKSDEAMRIMAVIVNAIIGKLNDDAVLYYCVPADALNADTNVAFHEKIMGMIIDMYDGQCKITHKAINEARAIVLSQIPDKTGIGISWGAGMVNVCYCIFGLEIFKFSIVGSGDWVDMESAKRFGYDPKAPNGDYKETPTSICRRKENLSLVDEPSDMVDKTIWVHYGILIENVIKGIFDGFRNNEEKARIDKPMPIVMAGGTSSPDGFTEYVQKVADSFPDKPFEIGEIKRADKPLYAVADGCYEAACLHNEE
jgi:hypothetical protein